MRKCKVILLFTDFLTLQFVVLDPAKKLRRVSKVILQKAH